MHPYFWDGFGAGILVTLVGVAVLVAVLLERRERAERRLRGPRVLRPPPKTAGDLLKGQTVEKSRNDDRGGSHG